MKNINMQTLSGVSDQIREKQISPVDVTKACLDRIRELNSKLNAFITVLEDDAIKSAKEAEKEINACNWKGPLHGIPVAVKDFYDTAGIRTTAAFEKFKDRIPKKDATVVSMLKKNGAILVGKTNMHTLGMGTTSVESFFGPVHNPIYPDYVAGGSSGGSAVAVATGMSFATVDTDAVGSCRIPAACCGVAGFKTSNGLINMEGILAGEKADEAIIQFSAAGITTRSADDLGIMLAALTGNKKGKPDTNPGNFRIGIVDNFSGNSEIRNAFLEMVENLNARGYATFDIKVPFDKAKFDLKNLGKDRKAAIELVFDNTDFLLLPTLNDHIPTVEEAKNKGPQAIAPANTFFCNYFGLPAISIPYSKDKKGFPLSFQVVGKPMQDWQVIEFAQALLHDKNKVPGFILI